MLIVADDLGFSDLGSHGSEIPTPALDRLASRGLRYSQFYNNGRCSPSRASLLTGLYPHRAGVGHMTADLLAPSYRGFLTDRAFTIAEVLKAGGYQTLMVGKWHVGSEPPHWPRRRGFDRYFGVTTGGVYFKENFAVRSEARLVEDDRVLPVPDDFYATEAFTDRAVAFLDAAARRKAPFFLYLAHIAPHFPLQARPEEIDRHRARYQAGWDEVRAARWKRLSSTALLATTLPPRDPEALPWNEESPSARADQALRMAIYAAQVEALDRSVDRVVARLQAIGRLENTLIMFLSDNGGCGEGGRHGFDRSGGEAVGTRRSYHSIGSSWANVSNTPFRRFKHYIHEGGIATPFIVHWPARIDPNAHGGAIRHDVGHVMDVLPTILEATGMRAPRTRNGKKALTVDGISLLASFTGAGKPRPAPLFWEHEGNRGVRDGDWKLVAVHGGPWELYDLRKDRTELTNVAAQNRDVVDRLGAAYQEWARLNEVVPWSRLEAAAAASSPSRGARAAEGEESRP